MAASRLNPNMWNGEERSGGNLNKNTGAKSATAPDMKGPVYIKGVGWYWLSVWVKHGKYGEFYSTSHREMSDEDVKKYVKPKPSNYQKTDQTSRPPIPPAAQNGADSQDGDIPF